MPNETWQSDFTHYRLTPTPGVDVEIISWLDDCTRYALHVSAHHRVTAPIVTTTFRETLLQHGIPASTLTDNGMVYTVRLRRRPRRTQQLRDRAETPGTWSRRTPGPATPRPAARPRVPADDEEVAPRPTRPTEHNRRTAAAPRHLHRGVQPPPAPPLTPAPSHPSRPLPQLPKAAPARVAATPRPTTGSATTASTNPAT